MPTSEQTRKENALHWRKRGLFGLLAVVLGLSLTLSSSLLAIDLLAAILALAGVLWIVHAYIKVVNLELSRQSKFQLYILILIPAISIIIWRF